MEWNQSTILLEWEWKKIELVDGMEVWAGQTTNQSIINKKQMSLLCCVDWWLCCFGWPPHKFISWIWIAALFFAFALLKFHSSISNAAKGPTARQLFLYFFSSPIRKSELERNKESWMGWASHQSVHLPQIQIKLTHRFVFVYNSWLAAYTVIILFDSINFNS